MDEYEEKIIDNYLDKLVNICLTNSEDLESIFKIISEIWNLEPFVVGNTRTLIAYLKVINCFFFFFLDIEPI